MREPRMNGGQLWQRVSNRRLADAQVVAIGILSLLGRGHADAQAQSHRHQPEERGHFIVCQRMHSVIAGRHSAGGTQRVGLAERRVRHRDGEVVDGMAEHHVAEVNEPRHALSPDVDQNVVVVGVAVDRAAPQ